MASRHEVQVGQLWRHIADKMDTGKMHMVFVIGWTGSYLIEVVCLDQKRIRLMTAEQLSERVPILRVLSNDGEARRAIMDLVRMDYVADALLHAERAGVIV